MFFNQKVDATRGNLTRILWRIAWPLVIVNFIQLVYNFTDTFWVSRLPESNQAISAVGISFQVMFIMVSLAGGFAVSVTTLVSQFYGARDSDNLNKTCYTSFILMGGFALAITVAGLSFREPLMAVLRTPTDILPYAREYFSVIMSGIFFMFLFFIISSILRGVGDTVTAMVAGTVSGFINMVLDPFLIFGWGPFPRLGVAGAAWATVVSQGLVSLYLVWFVFSGKKHIRLSLREIRFSGAIASRMVRIGFPAGLSQVALSLGASALLGRVNTFGTYATTAYTLGQRMDSLLFMPAMSISQAVATVVGQNLGAGQPDRARKSGKLAIGQAFGIVALVGVFIAFFPEFFFSTIFSADSNVLAVARYYALYMSFGYAFMAVRITINGIFQGAATTTRMLVMTLVSLALRLAMGYAGSFTSLGVRGLFLGMSLSFVLSAVIMFLLYIRGDWMRRIDLIKPAEVQEPGPEDSRPEEPAPQINREPEPSPSELPD